MKPIHLLACLTVALTLLIDIVVVAGFRTSYDAPLMFYTGLVFGQLSLLAFWSSRPANGRAVRTLIALGVACCLSHPLGRVTGTSWAAWSTLLGLYVAITGTGIEVARRIGLRYGAILPAPSRQTAQPNRPRSQYTVGGILTLMTVVALACGLRNRVELPQADLLAVAGYGVSLIMTALVAFWSIASPQKLLTRLTVLTTTCVAAGWMMASAEGYQGVWFFTNVAIIEASVICAGFSIVQIGQLTTSPAN